MANTRISALTSATTPLAGTEVLPIVQSSTTVKVATNDLTVRNVRAAATTGILQVSGPTAGTTRTMTTPDANFTAARTDAAQSFSGLQTFGSGISVTSGKVTSVYGAGGDFVALFQNTTSGTPYGVWIKDAATPTAGYPLLNISDSAGTTTYLRVDSSNGNTTLGTGNLIIGTSGKGVTTGSSIPLGFGTNGSTSQATLSTSNEFKVTGKITSSTNASDLFAGDNGSSAQFSVTNTGVIYAQNTTIQSLSDVRLKENIVDAETGLNIISALRPVRFDWKTGYGNDQKNQLGFIAQEVEEIFPEMLGQWKIKDSEDAYKTIGTTALIPVLVKAIQQQQAMIESLNSKIEALQIK